MTSRDLPRDPAEADDSDNEVEIVVDMPQRAPKAKAQAKHKYLRFQPEASRVYPTTCYICVHFRPYFIACVLATAFFSRRQLAGRPPLTILPAPARTGIAVPPRALNNL